MVARKFKKKGEIKREREGESKGESVVGGSNYSSCFNSRVRK